MFWKKKVKPSRDQLVAKAKATATAKRTEIGDETLDKIRDAMTRRDNSALGQAKAQILAADKDKVMDNLSFLLRDKP